MSNVIQGSPEWHALRLGKVTASRVAEAVSRTKKGWGADRGNYMIELIAERLTGEVAQAYKSSAMQWGSEKEQDARAAYEFRTDQEILSVGFIAHPVISDSGASPDGLIGSDGMVEFKCPLTSTYIETLLAGEIPEEYKTQMQWQLACTGRKWCDFVSFDPRMPEAMQLFIQRVERDDQIITALEKDVREFLDEMAKKLAQLYALHQRKAA